MKRKIKAEIIAGSLNEHGQKITTWVLTYPRFIHAEMMTHRVFSRNAASSRAIPALKMIADIEADPFIPVAWQKEHKGMQGTEYIEDTELIAMEELLWRDDAKQAVKSAKMRHARGVTKQLINRQLETFQWYTAIFTTTETENFFNLRCPQYEFGGDEYKSRKDLLSVYPEGNTYGGDPLDYEPAPQNLLEFLQINEGQGEIHISLLAEAMWDSMNEYNYKQLKAGEWHIPFGDNISKKRIVDDILGNKLDMSKTQIIDIMIKIATARCARVSYNNFEGKDDYEADIKLYDILKSSGHYSPFEHCAQAMSDSERDGHFRVTQDNEGILHYSYGWSGNFRGFVQLRQTL